jgi:hypothetical protein
MHVWSVCLETPPPGMCHSATQELHLPGWPCQACHISVLHGSCQHSLRHSYSLRHSWKRKWLLKAEGLPSIHNGALHFMIAWVVSCAHKHPDAPAAARAVEAQSPYIYVRPTGLTLLIHEQRKPDCTK